MRSANGSIGIDWLTTIGRLATRDALKHLTEGFGPSAVLRRTMRNMDSTSTDEFQVMDAIRSFIGSWTASREEDFFQTYARLDFCKHFRPQLGFEATLSFLDRYSVRETTHIELPAELPNINLTALGLDVLESYMPIIDYSMPGQAYLHVLDQIASRGPIDISAIKALARLYIVETKLAPTPVSHIPLRTLPVEFQRTYESIIERDPMYYPQPTNDFEPMTHVEDFVYYNRLPNDLDEKGRNLTSEIFDAIASLKGEAFSEASK